MKSCPDCGGPVLHRYSKRCKSCAAKLRIRIKPNTAQLAEARKNSPTHKINRPRPYCINTPKLKRLIAEYGANPADLGELAHCDRRTIERALAGKPVNFATIDQLAVALNVHIDSILQEAS